MSVNDSPVSPQAVLYNPYGQNIGISTDIFGRLRVSNPVALFDSKQINGNGVPLYFTEFTASGGLVTYNAASASCLLSVTNAVGSRALRQSRVYHNYQPGKSQLIFITFAAAGAVAGVQKRAGYYDDNNGVFLQLNGTVPGFVVRTNTSGVPVDTIIPQSGWNLDKLDGTGPSGLTIDFTRAQILVINYQWLGVGAIQFGFDLNGTVVMCHQVNNANSVTQVYMATPNLPVRWEVLTTGSAGSLDAICCTVVSEGGQQQPLGISRAVDRGGAAAGWKALAAANPEQVIALRLQAGKRGPAYIQDLDFVVTASQDTYWALCINPTVGGVAVWTPLANSIVEFDINLTVAASRIVSNFGTVIASGYVSSVFRSGDLGSLGVLQNLSTDYAGTPDAVSLVMRPVGNINAAASIRFIEPS